ncbi:hypothetical protein HPB51_004508 [Rhipicephalus microplus]|uniref:BACK domain-containing protein n=1 Tax=Rhipicephalus microplus TaxID=6941 RepID=A0A9J6ELA8_RHIMP|nr:hypothetical protein HPB51_004508 [Rhipicephalus microplus]
MSWQSLLSMADVYSQGRASVHEDLRRRRLYADAEVTCSDDGSQFPVHLVLLYATCPLFRETSPGGNLTSPPCTIKVPAVKPGAAVAIAPAEMVDAAISTTNQGHQSAAPTEAGEVTNIAVAGVPGDVMAALLEYVYTNRVTLNSDNVLSMLLSAQRFKQVAKAYQDLLRSSYDDLKALLSSDDLNVADEAKAFSVTIKSTSAGAPSRHLFLTSFQSAIRDLLFVIGGWGCDTAANLVERYGCRSNRWLIFPNDRDIMPQVYHHELVVLDGLVYLIGGSDRSQCFNCVRCFNPVRAGFTSTKQHSHEAARSTGWKLSAYF